MPALLATTERPPPGAGRHRAPATRSTAGWVAVAVFTLFNAAYVGWWCPHDLAPDEAHYWDWSRQLDWGYYSKGPLIAWLIRAGCGLFGDTPFGVRSVAVACGGLLLAGLWTLTRLATANPRLALGVLLVAITHPAVSAAGVVATIDGPFLACWAWALVAAFRRRWVGCGLLVAVGTLAKPTMLLFPVCVGLLIAFRPEWRSRRVWLFAPLSLLGLIPQVAWNAAHDWVSVRHLFGHAGNGGEATAWYSPLAFVGGQVALLCGVWFAAWVAAACRFRPGRGNATTAFLWFTSVPVFAAFLAASVKTAGEINWPAAAYLSGAVLVGMWASRTSPPVPLSIHGEGVFMGWRFPSLPRAVRAPTASGARTAHGEDNKVSESNTPSPFMERGTGGEVLSRHHSPAGMGSVRRRVFIAIILGGVLASVLARWPNLVRPLLAAVAPPSGETPVRRLDPTARLAGWRTLAVAVDEVRAGLDDPVLVTMAWTVPGELAFYCDGHPAVYTFAPAVGDRASQYDLWRPNPVADAQEFAGRPFVYVGDELPDGVFDRIEPVRRVTHSEGGVPLANWTVWVGRGYRGFDHRNRPPPRY